MTSVASVSSSSAMPLSVMRNIFIPPTSKLTPVSSLTSASSVSLQPLSISSSSITLTENATLTALNTMRLHSVAQRLVMLTDPNEVHICESIRYLQTLPEPLFVLSGGSNVLLPEMVSASVIQPLFTGIHVLTEDDQHIEIEVMAGENWHNLVTTTVNQGWYGLENLALIPGLVGAAPVQNIGAYGVQLDERLTHVRALHLPSLSWHTFTKAACAFGYRDSKFKHEPRQWLITRVGLRLHKDAERTLINYGDVAATAQLLATAKGKTSPSAVEVMTAIIAIRSAKLPDPARLPNCGSFFKNPIIPTKQFEALKRQYPDIVGYPLDNSDTTKVAAGWLIDKAGLKGNGIAPIVTHQQQALVLVNQAQNPPATIKDVLATQQFIQTRILSQFGIALEREPVLVTNS